MFSGVGYIHSSWHITAEHTASTDSIELMYIGISYITIPIAVIAYRRINAERDAVMASGGGKKYTSAELRELGDRAPDFRYTL